MKANKLGIAFVVAVLGLAGIGASYAGFTDEIIIEGTASTGSVDLKIVAISGTWVWKQISTHEKIVHHGWVGDMADYPYGDQDAAGWTPEYDGDDYALEAYTIGEIAEDDKITMTFHELFPLQPDDVNIMDYYMFDVLFHYQGKTPARITADPVDMLEFDYDMDGGGDPDYDPWMDDLMTAGTLYFDAFLYHIDEGGDFNFDPDSGVYTYPDPGYYDPSDVAGNAPYFEDWIPINGGQVHFCDFLKLDIFIDIPQDDEMSKFPDFEYENFQDLGVKCTWTIDLIQFDEW